MAATAARHLLSSSEWKEDCYSVRSIPYVRPPYSFTEALANTHSPPFLSFTPSCVDGYGRSGLVTTLLALILNEDLPAQVAIEIIRQHRGAAAVQTIKVL